MVPFVIDPVEVASPARGAAKNNNELTVQVYA